MKITAHQRLVMAGDRDAYVMIQLVIYPWLYLNLLLSTIMREHTFPFSYANV